MSINPITNSNKIIDLFTDSFKLNKYKTTLQTEGLSSIILLTKSRRFTTNPKLSIFINNNWYANFFKTNNKILYLQHFNECYKNKKYDKADIIMRELSHKNLYKSKSSPLLLKKIIKTRGRRGAKIKKANKSEPIISYNKKIWLSIGINDYKYYPKLENAVNDAIELTKFVKEMLNFQTFKLINEGATKYNIEHMLKNILFQSTDTNDLLVISFHGHGETLNINNTNYGFIVPFKSSNDKTPAELISMNDFSNWTQYLKPNHILILLDCCFSGFSAIRGKRESFGIYTKETIYNILNRKSRIIINAGTETQHTSDGGWGNNSIFTGSILSYPNYENQLGSVLNLYNYIFENITKHVGNQTPTMGKMVGDHGGDIFLAL